MKPISQPHDPLDDLLAAAVHGELAPAQRAELEALLQHDPAARAAYQEIQTMHDLLERNHRDIKPDSNFEDRMISGIRRKTREEKAHRETAWESALLLWRGLGTVLRKRPWKAYAGAMAVILILAGIAEGPITSGIQKAKAPEFIAQLQQNNQALKGQSFFADAEAAKDRDYKATVPAPASAPALADMTTAAQPMFPPREESIATTTNAWRNGPLETGSSTAATLAAPHAAAPLGASADIPAPQFAVDEGSTRMTFERKAQHSVDGLARAVASFPAINAPRANSLRAVPDSSASTTSTPQPATPAAPADSRKLIRDATLDLEVKAYQPTVDAITALAKADGGYLDSSNSQRGGNGKLQGSVVAKVAPDKLDDFLLKLRELGELKNQSVSTEDVTKEYVDTQARLDNSRHMETQLQELLKHNTNKVADLLEVERELGRVRGEIEQMEGQLKLYDFQVQYATVTISVAEKDLNKTAAYLLQEQDQFSLFVHNVEDAFAQAKAAADTFKAEILNANLQHESDNTMSATLAFSVPPEQVDAFLAKVKGLGRVDNFTRTTTRVANDGGNGDEPADQTRTEKDHAQVQLIIRADDESPRQQTQLTVASTGDIDTQAQQLKDSAAQAGAAVIAASFERATDGTETASVSFRLPLAKAGDLTTTLQKLGRVESLTVQRNDRPDQAPADDGAPAEIDLKLHNVAATHLEDETPRQQTQLDVASTDDVDAQAQQVKADALKSGAALTGSTFTRRPDGTEQAVLTFRLPLTQAAAFTATLEKLGKVESLAVQRNDVTGPNSIDPNAPAEIDFTLHNEPAVVAEDRGFGATLRHIFGGGIEAFLGSVATIGVLLAYLLPWAAALAVVAWIVRRLWVMRRAARS